jgi:hypothetical protein
MSVPRATGTGCILLGNERSGGKEGISCCFEKTMFYFYSLVAQFKYSGKYSVCTVYSNISKTLHFPHTNHVSSSREIKLLDAAEGTKLFPFEVENVFTERTLILVFIELSYVLCALQLQVGKD